MGVGRTLDDPEFWRDAHVLIERHANMAELAAAMEVDRFIAHGDREARAKRVLSAIKAMRRGARQANETLPGSVSTSDNAARTDY
jgi:pentose-5-phosphate-3-epimerase